VTPVQGANYDTDELRRASGVWRLCNERLQFWWGRSWDWPYFVGCEAPGLFLFACGLLRGSVYFRSRR
jgi:hypothetical protein